ncbi:MAG: trigger factor [Ilumatobacteraceae bacterium]|nr:trigger factor [Ilumatobacteraceae bacterium]
MKSSVEPLEGNKVKLYVEVEEDEFERDIDRAFKEIAKEVRLPGFRNGKVPRKVLEARVGLAPAREQALRNAVPEYLAKAVREHDVDLIATPEVEITDGEEEGPVEFDATCEIRPTVTVAGYGGLRVEVPALEVDDDALKEARDEELARSAALVDVDRAAEHGDFVDLDIAAERDGEELAGLNVDGWSYEIGQGWVSDDFDEHITGVSVGDELSFETTPKGTEEPAQFSITVNAVQTRELPEATDEWVEENTGEFETVAEWEASIRERLGDQRLGAARQQLVPGVRTALAKLVEIDVPEPMIDSALNRRMQGVVQQFAAQGVDLQQWLEMTGQEPEQFVDQMRAPAEEDVRVDLALRAVADAETLEVEDGELDAEYERLAMQYQQKPKEIRKVYEQNDAVPELIAQIRTGKAMDWLMRHTEFVDDAGTVLDRDHLLGLDQETDTADDTGSDDPLAADVDQPESTTDTEDPS